MTSRELLIRKMTFADLDDLYELLSDREVMRYVEPPFSKEKTVQFLMDAGLSEKPLVYENEARYPGEVIKLKSFEVQGVARHVIKAL